MGGKPTEIEGFYPVWELDSNAIKCLSVTDTPPPSYMVNDPTFWIDYDIETCCTRRYAWAKDTCISASREAAGSSGWGAFRRDSQFHSTRASTPVLCCWVASQPKQQ